MRDSSLPLRAAPVLPAQADWRCEFHWLEFRGEFMPWRWERERWHSIHTPGARFSPEELAGHGWRYVQAWPPPAAIAQVRRQISGSAQGAPATEHAAMPRAQGATQ